MRTLVTVVEHCSESSPGDIPEPVKEKTTVEVNKKLPREKKSRGMSWGCNPNLPVTHIAIQRGAQGVTVCGNTTGKVTKKWNCSPIKVIQRLWVMKIQSFVKSSKLKRASAKTTGHERVNVHTSTTSVHTSVHTSTHVQHHVRRPSYTPSPTLLETLINETLRKAKNYGTLSIYHRLMLISIFNFLDLHRFLATPSSWRYNHEGAAVKTRLLFRRNAVKA